MEVLQDKSAVNKETNDPLSKLLDNMGYKDLGYRIRLIGWLKANSIRNKSQLLALGWDDIMRLHYRGSIGREIFAKRLITYQLEEQMSPLTRHQKRVPWFLLTGIPQLDVQLQTTDNENGSSGGGIKSGSLVGFYSTEGQYLKVLLHQITLLMLESNKKSSKVLYVSSKNVPYPEDLLRINMYWQVSQERIESNYCGIWIDGLHDLDELLRHHPRIGDFGVIILDNIFHLGNHQRYAAGPRINRSRGKKRNILNRIMLRLKKISEVHNSIVIFANELSFTRDGFSFPMKKKYVIPSNLENHTDISFLIDRSTGKECKLLRDTLQLKKPIEKYASFFKNSFVMKYGFIEIRCLKSSYYNKLAARAMFTPFGLFDFSDSGYMNRDLYQLLIKEMKLDERIERSKLRKQRGY